MIAVTGSTGHLGQSIIRQLNGNKIPFRAIVHRITETHIKNPFGQSVQADINDLPSLCRAFDGVEAVIHSAALIDIRKGHMPMLRKVNVEGTKNVVAACIQAKVKRLVYISSIEAIDITKEHRPIREDFGFANGNAVMDYGDSKAEASRFVQSIGYQGKLETLVICPTGLIGPWDFRQGLFTSMIVRYLNKTLPALIPGGFDFTDVRDVAGVAINCCTLGRSGDIFLASGKYHEIRPIFDVLETISGIRAPRIMLSLTVARLASKLMEDGANLFNQAKVPLTRGSLTMLSKNAIVDSSRARAEIGYRARPIEGTLTDLVHWIREPHDDSINPNPCWK